MADVRGATGAPAVGAFAGGPTPTPSTPLYVNLTNGDLYVLVNETATKVGSVANDSNLVITQQSMGNHYVTPINAADANVTLAQQTMARHTAIQTDVADANATLAQRTFSSTPKTASVVFGDASTVLATSAFAPRPLPAMWS